ncbi:hypothetical protein [Flindersiella endophytica]
MDWTTLLPTALGGILALAGGAMTQIISLRSERRKRVHQRSDDAAKAILDRCTDLLVGIRRSYIMDAQGEGYADGMFEGYLEDEYQRDFVTISANAALIDDSGVRQLLTDLVEAVSVGGMEAAERLLGHGQTVAGAYLRGKSLRELEPDLRKRIDEDLASAKRARDQLLHPASAQPLQVPSLKPVSGDPSSAIPPAGAADL